MLLAAFCRQYFQQLIDLLERHTVADQADANTNTTQYDSSISDDEPPAASLQIEPWQAFPLPSEKSSKQQLIESFQMEFQKWHKHRYYTESKYFFEKKIFFFTRRQDLFQCISDRCVAQKYQQVFVWLDDWSTAHRASRSQVVRVICGLARPTECGLSFELPPKWLFARLFLLWMEKTWQGLQVARKTGKLVCSIFFFRLQNSLWKRNSTCQTTFLNNCDIFIPLLVFCNEPIYLVKKKKPNNKISIF